MAVVRVFVYISTVSTTCILRLFSLGHLGVWGELASHKRLFNPPSQFSRLGIQVSYYSFFPVLIMYIMCIVCLGYLSFFPTSAIASVLCTCISMYLPDVIYYKTNNVGVHYS